MLKLAISLAVATVGLVCFVLLLSSVDAKGQSVEGFPLDIRTNGPKPGSIKLGGVVNVSFTVRNNGFSTMPKLQLGLPGAGPILQSSHRLIYATKDASPIWNAGPLKAGASKTLTVRVKVESPPPDTSGFYHWCPAAEAAPSLMKGPPAWSVFESICYHIPL